MKKQILVIGSINADTTLYLERFPNEGETLLAKEKTLSLGGKGANQAVAISRAGGNVAFLGAIGNDAEGAFLFKSMEEEGLSEYLYKSKGSSGGAYIEVDAYGRNRIAVYEGANKELTKEVLDEYVSLIEEADILLFQNETSSLPLEELFQRYGKSKTIIYNPAPAKGSALTNLSGVSYFIPNQSELALLSKETDIKKGIDKMLSLGVRNVIVTLGEKGSLLANEGGYYECPAFKVKAIDTVAAGDTYVGYLAASLGEGISVEKAMQIASKASAIAVTRRGGVPSIPSKEEVYS